MGDVINDSFLRSIPCWMSEPDFARLSPVLGGQPTMMLGYAPEVGAEASSIARDFDEALLGVGQTCSEARSDERQTIIRFPELIGELDRSTARRDLTSFGRLGARPNIDVFADRATRRAERRCAPFPAAIGELGAGLRVDVNGIAATWRVSQWEPARAARVWPDCFST
jgi:hypothetical protein